MKRTWLWGYLAAPLVTGLALPPWLLAGSSAVPSSILLLLGAVMATSRYGGLGPGLLAGLLGASVTVNFFLPHEYSFGAMHFIAGIELCLFVLVALSISWINASLLRSRSGMRMAERRLRRQLDFTNAITTSLGEGVYAVDRDGRLTFLNATAQQILGWSDAELRGQNIHLFLHRHKVRSLEEGAGECVLLEAFYSSQTSLRQEDTFSRRDGAVFPVDYVSWPIVTDGQRLGAVVAFHDITERKRTEEDLRASRDRLTMQYAATRVLADSRDLTEAIPKLLRQICESGGWDIGAFWVVDPEEGVLRCHDFWHPRYVDTHAFDSMTRQSSFRRGMGLLGRVWASEEPIWVPDVARYPDYRRAAAASDQQLHAAFCFPIFVENSVHSVLEFLCHAEHALDPDLAEAMTTIGAQIGQFIERKQVEAALAYQALHDALTDLPNRTLLHDRLQQAILNSRRESGPLSLLVMDLDRFKEVNDTYGHHYGDLLLEQLKPRLRDNLRDSDTVARLGGDEFAAVLPATDEAGATRAARKILNALKEPFSLEGSSFDVEASIGIAVFPAHGEDANVLMRRADVAMYVAKASNQGYAVYRAEEDPNSPGRLARIRDLRHAVENDTLGLCFQAKAAFDTLGVEEVEALARWYHPHDGCVPADEFIGLAERTGLIRPLSERILNRALEQCRVWHDAGLQLRVAVNLSARNLHDPGLARIVAELLDRWQVHPAYLAVEITESAIMVDPDSALTTLVCLHDTGVRISLDDFGTGYSSLAYLKRLPADELKIDRSFVVDMAVNEDDAFIAKSVIDLGHNLGLRVVAEGVENQATWNLLQQFGCDAAQGNYVSPPLPADDLVESLSQGEWRGVDVAL